MVRRIYIDAAGANVENNVGGTEEDGERYYVQYSFSSFTICTRRFLKKLT